MAKPGRDFEEAVARFVAALDPSAKVHFDHKVPDRHTLTPRQVDVWISAQLGGHIPYNVLVSCKDHARPLDIGDVGAFYGERESTAAHMGIIYSAAGFTKPALEKARALGISCCRLYRNQPSEMPTSVMFTYYCCVIDFDLVVDASAITRANIETWDQFLDRQAHGGTGSLIDRIQQIYEENLLRKPQDSLFPANWTNHVEVFTDNGQESSVTVKVNWKRYRGKVEAALLDGSYCYDNGSFWGSQFSPSFDRLDPPGPGWTEIQSDEPEPSVRGIVLTVAHADIKSYLRKRVAGHRFV